MKDGLCQRLIGCLNVRDRNFEKNTFRSRRSGFLTLEPLYFYCRMCYQNIKSANSIFKSFVISSFRVPFHSYFMGHTKCSISYGLYDVDHIFNLMASSINGTLFSEVILLFFPFLVVKLKIR